eukprot:8700-Heterococcus_DN1.PRE.1
MSNDPACKRAAVERRGHPLTDVKILQRVLGFRGAGYWLVVAQVSKAWRLAYLAVKPQHMISQLTDDPSSQEQPS